MRQAIITKYFGPTDHKGSRIKATCATGSIIIPYAYNLNTFENHEAAALELKEKFGWINNDTTLIAATMPKDDGYCFTQIKVESRLVVI